MFPPAAGKRQNVMRNVEGQTQGSYLAQFQEDFAAFTGAGHAFAVDNATNALSLAATLCGIRPGDAHDGPGLTGDLPADILRVDGPGIRMDVSPDDPGAGLAEGDGGGAEGVGCGFASPGDRSWSPAMSNVDMDIEGFWPNNFCIGEAQCALGSVELRSRMPGTRAASSSDRTVSIPPSPRVVMVLAPWKLKQP